MQVTEAFWDMCEHFVREIHEQTALSPIVCDGSGVIRKAVDVKRIGTVHRGAQEILSGSSDNYAVTADEARTNPLVKEGYNCAVVVDGQKVATFGIGGTLEITKPVARTAALVLASWIAQLQQNAIVRSVSLRFATDVDRLSNSVLETTAEFERVNEAILLAGRNARETAHETDKLLRSVEQISEQIHIISLNARIEASRLTQGDVFNAISNEMTTLARTAHDAAQEAQRLLEALRSSIVDVDEAVQQSSRMFARNVQQSHAVVNMIKQLHKSIETLNIGLDSELKHKPS